MPDDCVLACAVSAAVYNFVSRQGKCSRQKEQSLGRAAHALPAKGGDMQLVFSSNCAAAVLREAVRSPLDCSVFNKQ